MNNIIENKLVKITEIISDTEKKSEWNPSIVRIEKVEKHPNADRLDICTILGAYPVITKRDQFKAGDLASYIPIDSILPDNEFFYDISPVTIKDNIITKRYELGSLPESSRLVKARKIRGIFSMGILYDPIPNLQEHDSIVEHFSLTKFEELEEDHISFGRGEENSPPKDWSIPKFSLNSFRKYPKAFEPGEEVVCTLKIHGSTIGMRYNGEKFWVKSSRFYKKDVPGCMWWETVHKLGLDKKLTKYTNYVYFGELYGQVKKFAYDANNRNDLKIRIFEIYDLSTMKYLNYDEFVKVTTELNVDVAPVVYKGPFTSFEELKPLAEGPDPLNSKHVREGFVIKPVINRSVHSGRLILKMVGEGYQLAK